MSTLAPIVHRSAGLDVRQKTVVACLLWENQEGKLKEKVREFTTYPDQLQALADWLKSHAIELTVMESTGVYWKNAYKNSSVSYNKFINVWL